MESAARGDIGGWSAGVGHLMARWAAETWAGRITAAVMLAGIPAFFLLRQVLSGRSTKHRKNMSPEVDSLDQ